MVGNYNAPAGLCQKYPVDRGFIRMMVGEADVRRDTVGTDKDLIEDHPLGGLDGLLLLRVLGMIRRDVRIVANELLMNIRNISDFLLPVAAFRDQASRGQLSELSRAIEREECVIVFPSGEVSRPSLRTIRDRVWHKGAVHLAQKHRAPILPLHIQGRNSLLFYAVSLLARRLSILMLPRQLFFKRKKPVRLRIGEIIPWRSFSGLHAESATTLLRNQVESLASGRTAPFRATAGNELPVDRKILRADLLRCSDTGSPAPGITRCGTQVRAAGIGVIVQ